MTDLFNYQEDDLTPKQTASELGVKVGTLRTWRYRKSHNLPWVNKGGKIFYRREDVEKFKLEWIQYIVPKVTPSRTMMDFRSE